VRGLSGYLGKRLLQSLLVLWVVVTLLFLMFRLLPGNPLVAYISPTFTEQQQEAMLDRFGLADPLPVQYAVYLGNLLEGDLGQSFFHQDSVVALVMDVLPNTLYLTLMSLAIAYAVGMVGGLLLAARRGSSFEKVGVTFTLMTRAAPEFWVGMLLLVVFAFGLQWFPSSGAASPGVTYASEVDKLTSLDFWRHLALPAVTLALYLHGLPLLLMRSSMLEVMQDDFVTMGRLIGYSEKRILVRHAARNALLPVATAMALGLGYSLGGNVVVEYVFGWPGLGRMLVTAVSDKDYPLAQGAFLLIAIVMIGMNFLADVLYGVLDPRVGSSESEAQ
jgi:peptide/nickel transport system permease protein